MRLGRRQQPAPPRPKAIIAAASTIPLDGSSWRNLRLGDLKWQRDAWHQYDINGELRFIANWVGQACSRARIFVADVDELGRPGEETKDKEIQLLAETVFGGPAKKAEAQRLIGLHLFVPGESYIVAESVESADEDRWYVVSTSGIRREGTDAIRVERPQEFGGGWYTLKPDDDLLIRVWTQHPQKPDLADSSVRAALVPLREIEQLTKFEFAEIDSRLAGAGLLLLPEEVDFPAGDDDPDDAGGAQGLTNVLQKAMAASLTDRSDPASLVPIIVQVAGEYIDKIKHLTFGGELNDKVNDMKEGAMARLARALDVDPEILTGKGDTNHWSAWQIEESTIRLHIEPLISRMCDALTVGYLRAALKIMGKDPEKYTFWYDVSALTVQPDRQGDALELYREGVISADTLRKTGNFSDDEAPDKAENERFMAMKAVEADPALWREKPIQKALGISWELSEPAPEMPPDMLDGAAQPDKPGGLPGAKGSNVRQMPAASTKPGIARAAAATPGATSRQAAALMIGSQMAVHRALEVAGKRLLTRDNRHKYSEINPWDLHTEIRVLDRATAHGMIDGNAFAWVPSIAAAADVDPELLTDLLSAYVTELIVRGVPHNEDLLEVTLAHGLHAECGNYCANPAHPGSCTARARSTGWAVDAMTMDGQTDAYHLRGLHDQRDHGRRRGTDFAPFGSRHRIEVAHEREDRERGQGAGDRDAPTRSRHALVRGSDRTDEVKGLLQQGDLYRNDRLSNRDLDMVTVGKRQGFDGPATVVTKQEMDDLLADGRGSTEFWRGGVTTTPEAADAFADSMRRGEYGPGVGNYGNGYYYSTDKWVAEQYAGDTDKAEKSVLVRAALKPNARVIDYEQALERMATEEQRDPSPYSLWAGDVGRWAISKGYDAYTVNGPGCVDCNHGDGTEWLRLPGRKNPGVAPQMVILNRTATYVQDVNDEPASFSWD